MTPRNHMVCDRGKYLQRVLVCTEDNMKHMETKSLVDLSVSISLSFLEGR